MSCRPRPHNAMLLRNSTHGKLHLQAPPLLWSP